MKRRNFLVVAGAAIAAPAIPAALVAKKTEWVQATHRGVAYVVHPDAPTTLWYGLGGEDIKSLKRRVMKQLAIA